MSTAISAKYRPINAKRLQNRSPEAFLERLPREAEERYCQGLVAAASTTAATAVATATTGATAAAAAVAAATGTVTAAAATAVTTTTAAEAAGTWRTSFHRTGFVHGDCTAAE